MRKLEHSNIVKLKYFFYSSGDKVSMIISLALSGVMWKFIKTKPKLNSQIDSFSILDDTHLQKDVDRSFFTVERTLTVDGVLPVRKQSKDVT